eukprot:4082329-Karenia_brevis.AAC.1
MSVLQPRQHSLWATVKFLATGSDGRSSDCSDDGPKRSNHCMTTFPGCYLQIYSETSRGNKEALAYIS